MNIPHLEFYKKLRSILGFSDDIILFDRERLQKDSAPRLRAKAIEHLATGESVVARGFRDALPTYKNFLCKQKKNNTWATYIEAEALGALFEINIIVTSIAAKKEPKTWYLHTENPDAPTIHLFNKDNTHWFVDKHTIGDGNCLYNAFAQALRLFFILPEIIQQQIIACPSTSSKWTNQDLENEQKRIAALPREERIQIEQDRQFALSLASEEANHVGLFSQPKKKYTNENDKPPFRYRTPYFC